MVEEARDAARARGVNHKALVDLEELHCPVHQATPNKRGKRKHRSLKKGKGGSVPGTLAHQL